MLEGLEANEVLLSEMCLAARMDSGFAAFPERHYLEKILNHKDIKPISMISKYISSGHTPYLHNVKEGKAGDVDFVTVECISDLMLHKDKLKKITAKQFEEEFKRNRLQIGAVLCTIKRRICKAFPITKNYGDVAFNQDIAFIIPTHEVSTVYLATYLCSRVGQLFAKRQMTEQMNPYISVENLLGLPIVIASKNFQNKVELIFELADKCRTKSIFEYAAAETLLLETLDMTNFSPSTEGINIKTFKDSFAETGRLDAEYYQLKYEETMNKVRSRPYARLIELVSIQKSIEPGTEAYSDDESGLPFLRVADYSKHGITKPQKCLNTAFVAENCDNLDALKPKKNTILFSKDGSVGEAYCLREDANFVTSGAVLHLTVRNHKEVLPDYLTLALNSRLVRMQAERDAGGSIILHWRLDEIQNVIVPLLDMATQENIAAMVQESFALRTESERLLDVAKRAVEIAIEQDENASMAYIKVNS